jgi:hypothetical protein
VLILLLTLPVLMTVVWARVPNTWWQLSDSRYGVFATFAYAWSGGAFGGTLFDAKYLYHTVAKGSWNADRLVWRLLTPMISGGLAFGLVALVASGLLPLLDAQKIRVAPATVGFSMLAGYFSDNAIAALAKQANRLFGTMDSHVKRG